MNSKMLCRALPEAGELATSLSALRRVTGTKGIAGVSEGDTGTSETSFHFSQFSCILAVSSPLSRWRSLCSDLASDRRLPTPRWELNE